MDLKQYFKKIHELEATLADEYPVVVSLPTADGGKAGVLSEVSKAVAAKMIIDGRAVLATAAEKQKHLEQQAAAKKHAEQVELSRRVQVAIITDPNLNIGATPKGSNAPAGLNKQE